MRLIGFVGIIVVPAGRQHPKGAKGFPRGEAVTEIGPSQPISVTDEECGQESYGFLFVWTSSGSFDIAIPHPSKPVPKCRF